MGALWDAIALTDVEQEIVKALRLVSEDIQAVQMAGGDERWAHGRTAIAKTARYPARVPLKTFGDGVNRLFGIILSLCNPRNGVLLVDEIENGLHYWVKSDIWRTLFRLSRDLNVQVFATSHLLGIVSAPSRRPPRKARKPASSSALPTTTTKSFRPCSLSTSWQSVTRDRYRGKVRDGRQTRINGGRGG